MREEGNPLYNFLVDPDSMEGMYYRWRTYGKNNQFLGGAFFNFCWLFVFGFVFQKKKSLLLLYLSLS